MSSKLKCYQNWNVTKTDVTKTKKVTKIELSPKLKCHQNWNITKTEMSPKIKFHQKLMVTKTRISSKLKCHQNWNVTKTEMLPNIIIMSSKSKSKSKRSALITLVLFSRVTPFDMKRRPKSKIYKAQRMSSSVLFWHNHETHGINQGTCTAVLFQKTLVYHDGI